MLQDLRFALRLLVRDRSFTATAILTFAVCIGANAAMLGVVRSVLFEPLPVPDSHELVFVYNSYPNAGAARATAGVPDYFDRLDGVPALAEQALLQRQSVTVGDAGRAERVVAFRATPSFFPMARLEPLHGRIFRDDEGEVGANDRAILAYGFWQRSFGGDPSVVGTTIRVDGLPLSVVGVAPADFEFLWRDVDLYVPAAFTADEKGFNSRHSNNWLHVGRLAPGRTIAEVQAQVDAVNAANDARFPELSQILRDAGFHSVAVGLQDDLVSDVRPMLYLLWGGVVFVLVIGCSNIANLEIARSNARAGEMATRQALGAGAGRLARQLVTEMTVLALSGAVAGLALAWALLQSVAAAELDGLPRSHEVALDPTSIAGVLAIAVVIGVALGLAPVARMARGSLSLELREDGRSGTGGRRARLVRRGLATAQIAIAFVLLIGAGLLFASFRAVVSLDPGFDPERVYTARVSLPAGAYPDQSARLAFVRRATELLRAIPDVESTGATSSLPFTGDSSDSVILAEGYEAKPGESLISPSFVTVTPGYFETLRIPVVSGRLFDESDATGSTPTIILDERLAQRWWPEQDAVGRRVYFPTSLENLTAITSDTVFYNVIGVVREIRVGDPLAGESPIGAYYLPIGRAAPNVPRTMSFTVRTRVESPAIAARVREAIAQADPGLPLYRTGSLQTWIDNTHAVRRVPMSLALGFGAVGLFLAAVGIHGVLAYGVVQRRRELGVRIALGSSPAQLFTMVLRDGLKITVAGLAVGLIGAVLVGQAMESQLFGVSSADPAVLTTVALLLGSVAIAACLIPSVRATRIDPIDVLAR